MKKVLIACAFLGILGGSVACFPSQVKSDKPCHITLDRIGFGHDSLEIYFTKDFHNGSKSLEVRKVPISDVQTFCGYGIVAEDVNLSQRKIDSAADTLKVTFRVEVMYADRDESEITPLKFNVAE